MELKPGGQLRSALSTTEVVVVKGSGADVDLRCGGLPMIGKDEAASEGAIDEAFAGESLLGKRYVDDDTDTELLCTKPGDGALSIDGRVLGLKGAKPLPSSD